MASLAARLHSSRFQTYRPYSSPCYRCVRAHHSCCRCASSGRGPGSGRGYQPPSSGKPSGSGRGRGSCSSRTQGSSALPGEGRAPAAGTNHAPPGDRQATAVDEGPFCPELRVLRLIPTGVETRIPTGVEIRTNFRSGRQRFLHAAHARRLYQPSFGQQ